MRFARNMTVTDACRRLLSETGGVSDGLIPTKKPIGLTSKRKQQRTAVITDAEAIQRIYAPIALNTAISFEETPPSVEEIAQRRLNRIRHVCRDQAA